jgi:biotin transport system substrate-specific component
MHALTLERFRFSTWMKALGVLLCAVLTAASARISVLTPLSPVPLTLQVLVVILSGFALGWRGALLSQMLYLQAILLGAPWTASGLAGPMAFAAPTAGYLLSFPLAAALAGWFHERVAQGAAQSAAQGVAQGAWGRLVGGMAALVVIYALGALWLAGFVGGLANGWRLGVAPFLGADALKIVIASATLSLRRR